MPEWSPKSRSSTAPLFSVKLLIRKRRELNLETRLAFLDYVKAFDKVKRDKLFEILQSKNMLCFLIKSTTEIYSRKNKK
jgi:replication-associated recombination protein RarA